MTEPRPVVIVLASAGLSAIPVAGGPLQTIFDAVMERRSFRADATAREIAEAVGEDRLLARLLDSPQLEVLLGDALEASMRTGFEAKRRLLGRVVAEAFLNDDAIDPAVLVVDALDELEPVHVKALIRLERALATVDDSDDERDERKAVREFNQSQPAPVLATLENCGLTIPATYVGGGLGVFNITEFARLLLRELRAVADEEMERLVD